MGHIDFQPAPNVYFKTSVVSINFLLRKLMWVSNLIYATFALELILKVLVGEFLGRRSERPGSWAPSLPPY
jgi:hypothetical protein